MTNWLSTTINTTKLNTWHLTPRLWAPQELERKIFMVQQLSIFHGTYVVYVSFARGSTYPSRSAVADKILQCFPRRPLEEFWMMFITASPAEVEACKAVGITPAGFYNLQKTTRRASLIEWREIATTIY